MIHKLKRVKRGWRQVFRGKTRKGDRALSFFGLLTNGKPFFDAIPNCPVSGYNAVIRRKAAGDQEGK